MAMDSCEPHITLHLHSFRVQVRFGGTLFANTTRAFGFR